MQTIIAKLRLMHMEIDGQKRNAEALRAEIKTALDARPKGGDYCPARENAGCLIEALTKARSEITRMLGDLELAVLIDALPADAPEAAYHHLCETFQPSIADSRA